MPHDHSTLAVHKFVSTISQCTCCGGVDTALAAVAWNALTHIDYKGYL